jgi:hypothetical protein
MKHTVFKALFNGLLGMNNLQVLTRKLLFLVLFRSEKLCILILMIYET